MPQYYLSCKRFTVWVQTDGKVITDTAPLTHKFIGQPLSNLKSWASGFGGLVVKRLNIS